MLPLVMVPPLDSSLQLVPQQFSLVSLVPSKLFPHFFPHYAFERRPKQFRPTGLVRCRSRRGASAEPGDHPGCNEQAKSESQGTDGPGDWPALGFLHDEFKLWQPLFVVQPLALFAVEPGTGEAEDCTRCDVEPAAELVA